MDGYLLVLWAVRLLFLALIYLFLARVVRALLRDLRAAAREPADRPGRLIVLDSPSGEPPAGHSFGLDVDHRARPRRQQRHRHRRPVRVGRSRRPDLPRPELVRRGPRPAPTARTSTAGGSRASPRWASATSSRSARSGCGSSGPSRERDRGPDRPAVAASNARIRRIRPRPRWLEFRLLGLVAVDAAARAACRSTRRSTATFRCTTPQGLLVYIAALFVAHVAQVLAGRRTGPDPPADRRDARRDLAPADGATAAGPRQPDLLRQHARAWPRSS